MQESSDGSRGLPEHGRWAPNIDLVNQTRPQPPQRIPSTPIQEGQSHEYGQARFEIQNVDSDGAASLSHDVNQVNASQNIIQQSGQNPTEASPRNVPSRVVPSQRSAAQGQQQSDPQQPSRRTVQTPSLLNVDVRAEGNRDPTGHFSNGHSNIHGQSMSGFTGNDMNIPSGGHLIPFPSGNLDLHQQRDPQVPSCCMIPEPQLESVVSDRLENRLGRKEFTAKWQKCYKSFKDADFNHDTARRYADQLLSFQNIGNMVKCILCNESEEMDSPFVHSEDCPVHLSCQHGQRPPRNDLQLPSRSNGHNTQTSINRRPSENVSGLQSRSSNEAMHSAMDLRSSFLCPASSSATSSLPLGAVGGADTSDPETTKLKRTVTSGVGSVEKTRYKAVAIPNSNSPAGSDTWNSSLQYQTAPSRNSISTASNGSHGSQNIARYPAYSDLHTRLQSFHTWRHNHVQTPATLAEAGLYFSGTGDDCCCFYCGGVMKKWEADDNPWSEHARLFPECKYVIEKRGNKFVENIRKKSQQNESLSGSLPQNSMVNAEPRHMVQEDPLQTDVCRNLIEMGYMREDVQQAVHIFNSKAPRGKRYSVDELLDILLERIEHQSTPLSLTSRECLRSSTSFNKLNGEQASQAVLMDGSYCSVCNENRVAIIQYECRHVVCKQCKPADFGGPCRICGEKVVKCGAVDSDKF